MVKIRFFDNAQTKSENFSQNLFNSLKIQGEDSFLKNNSVSFVSSFLIGRTIRHIRIVFRMQDFF
jgi:hypothetical protein